jgi:monoterpene epsilon-lactone hydrolase
MRPAMKQLYGVAWLLTASASSSVTFAESPASRTVPGRALPNPDTVSATMQKVIGTVPDGSQNLQSPRTAEEWKALSAQRALGSARQLHELRERFGVTVAQQAIAGVNCYVISPKVMTAEKRNRLLVNLHGGAHAFRSGEAGTLEGIYMAGLAGLKVIAVDYRMPPDHPFPAAMDDAMAVWREIVKLVKPAHSAIFGISSGGGMVLSLVQRAKRERLPLPAAIMAGTPWSDLSKTGDSYFTNAGIDNVVVTYEGLLEAAAKLYANGRDLKDPLLSPVYGDFSGFPPTFLVAGTRDLFLSNTVRVHRKLRQVGVEAQLEIYEGQSHGQFLNPDAPETTELFTDIAKFFDAYLGL